MTGILLHFVFVAGVHVYHIDKNWQRTNMLKLSAQFTL